MSLALLLLSKNIKQQFVGAYSYAEFILLIQHGDSRRTALEEWITSSRAKPYEHDVNEEKVYPTMGYKCARALVPLR